MKKIITTLFVLFYSTQCFAGTKNKTSNKDSIDHVAKALDKKIAINEGFVESFIDLPINDSLQRVLIQSTNVGENPILLYLHGGPGSSLMMYSYLYEKKLKENYIYVNWDMRGAALSYRDGMDQQKISQGQIVEDTIVLIQSLLKKFQKDKIFLIGHSFGSALGLYLVDIYPELFHAYVGIGQVINYQKSVTLTFNWLHQRLKSANDIKGLQKINKTRFPDMKLIYKYGGHHNLEINLTELIKGSPYYFNGYLELLQKGKRFSAENVGRNPKMFGSNFEYIKKTTIPLYFFEGRNDHVIACTPKLVEDFVKNVHAPKKEIVWFEKSAHYIPVEEPNKFQAEMVKILKDVP